MNRREIYSLYEAFYIRSMLFNSGPAARTLWNIDAVFLTIRKNSPQNPAASLSTTYLLDELLNLINQATALARYFWPVRNGHEWRGNAIRETFAIEDNDPLRSRDLRNACQ